MTFPKTPSPKRLGPFHWFCFLPLLLFLQTGLAADYDTPPRVSFFEGKAVYESSGQVDWTEVTSNLPLLSGDRLFSQQGAKVEVEIGKGSYVRLSENTDVVFLQTTGKQIVLALIVGDLVLRVNDKADYQVRLPNGSVEVRKQGLYRFSVDEASGESRVTVRKGSVQVQRDTGKQRVEGGEELLIRSLPGSGGQLVAASFPDEFDLWSDRRDARYVQSASMNYVGGYTHGIVDLDFYGSWSNVYGHGWAWFPRVSIGWVPYRSGCWVRYPRWGWTWVSYEPWGWAPYHYGRWVYYSPYSRWCWVPGASFSFGWSPHHVSFYYGNGYVGWAPRGYGHTTVIHDNSVNIVNNTIVNGRGGRSRGMTMVREQDFSSRNPRAVELDETRQRVVQDLRPGLPEGVSRRAAGQVGNRTASARTTQARRVENAPGVASAAPAQNLERNTRQRQATSWLFGDRTRSTAAESRAASETSSSPGRSREQAITSSSSRVQARSQTAVTGRGASGSLPSRDRATEERTTGSIFQARPSGGQTTVTRNPAAPVAQSRSGAVGRSGSQNRSFNSVWIESRRSGSSRTTPQSRSAVSTARPSSPPRTTGSVIGSSRSRQPGASLGTTRSRSSSIPSFSSRSRSTSRSTVRPSTSVSRPPSTSSRSRSSGSSGSRRPN